MGDRRTLISQTSEVADSLGLINHSVMMTDSLHFGERAVAASGT